MSALAEDAATLPAWQAARSAQQALYTGLRDIRLAEQKTRTAVGPGGNVVDGANIRRAIPESEKAALANAMSQKYESLARSFDKNLGQVNAVIERLDTDIERALTNPKRNEVATATCASDIRRMVAAMPDGKRVAWVHDSIVSGDHEVVSAILGTSPFVSGLDRAQMATLRDMARERFGGNAWKQHANAVKLRDHLTQSAGIFSKEYLRLLPVVKPSPAAAAVAALKVS
jgi:hypothetical protein